MNCKLSIVLTTTFCLGLLLTNPAWGGLTLWLDASDPTTILDGSGVAVTGGGFNPSDVATWNDKSGQGNHATQGTAADRPTWVFGGLNGLDILRWTHDQHVVIDPLSSSTTGTNPGMTAFMVLKSTGSGGFLEEIDGWLSHSTVGGYFINDRTDIGGGAFGTGGVEARFTGDKTVFHMITAKYDFSTGVATAVYNGDSASHTSCSPGSIPCTNPGATITFDQVARYFNGVTGGLAGEGDLAEIRLYDDHLSAAAENAVGFALGQKWGIPTQYVPEPSSWMLLGLGMIFGFWTRGRRVRVRG